MIPTSQNQPTNQPTNPTPPPPPTHSSKPLPATNGTQKRPKPPATSHPASSPDTCGPGRQKPAEGHQPPDPHPCDPPGSPMALRGADGFASDPGPDEAAPAEGAVERIHGNLQLVINWMLSVADTRSVVAEINSGSSKIQYPKSPGYPVAEGSWIRDVGRCWELAYRICPIEAGYSIPVNR